MGNKGPLQQDRWQNVKAGDKMQEDEKEENK